jgi:hypothetical protein
MFPAKDGIYPHISNPRVTWFDLIFTVEIPTLAGVGAWPDRTRDKLPNLSAQMRVDSVAGRKSDKSCWTLLINPWSVK